MSSVTWACNHLPSRRHVGTASIETAFAAVSNLHNRWQGAVDLLEPKHASRTYYCVHVLLEGRHKQERGTLTCNAKLAKVCSARA